VYRITHSGKLIAESGQKYNRKIYAQDNSALSTKNERYPQVKICYLLISDNC